MPHDADSKLFILWQHKASRCILVVVVIIVVLSLWRRGCKVCALPFWSGRMFYYLQWGVMLINRKRCRTNRILERGADTCTTAAYGAGAVDTVEGDTAGAGVGNPALPETSQLEPMRSGRKSTISGGSALTFVRGGATSNETSWTSQQETDGRIANKSKPPKIGGQDGDPAVAPPHNPNRREGQGRPPTMMSRQRGGE